MICMSLSHFLSALVDSGRITISPDFDAPAEAEAEAILMEMNRLTQLNLAGNAPEFMPAMAVWAAQLLHHSCQFLVCRDLDETVINQAFQEPCPLPRSPATDYSADLSFQYLPDLIGMTRQVAAGDPLLQRLLVLAREWPLSSVGVPGLESLDIQSFISDPCLRQLYVDRIIAHEDLSRLGEPLVDRAVREALGAFPELCRKLAAQLEIPVITDQRKFLAPAQAEGDA
jgi:hypothetical protein